MGEIYEPTRGARLAALTENTERGGAPVRLDGSEHAERAIDALRSMAAAQISERVDALRVGWAKVDLRVLHLLEDPEVHELREIAEEIAEALRFLEAIAPWIDDDDDDAPQPVPDPAGDAHA